MTMTRERFEMLRKMVRQLPSEFWNEWITWRVPEPPGPVPLHVADDRPLKPLQTRAIDFTMNKGFVRMATGFPLIQGWWVVAEGFVVAASQELSWLVGTEAPKRDPDS